MALKYEFPEAVQGQAVTTDDCLSLGWQGGRLQQRQFVVGLNLDVAAVVGAAASKGE